MKKIILLSLILFASCNGSHSSGNLGSSNGQSNMPTAKAPSSSISEQKLVENYTSEVKSTIHRDLKIQEDDINSINSEVDLTHEEQQALNSLK